MRCVVLVGSGEEVSVPFAEAGPYFTSPTFLNRVHPTHLVLSATSNLLFGVPYYIRSPFPPSAPPAPSGTIAFMSAVFNADLVICGDILSPVFWHNKKREESDLPAAPRGAGGKA